MARVGAVVTITLYRRGVIARDDHRGPRILHEDMAMLNEELLALLVCPMGKAPLRREGDMLVCTRCGPRFAIRNDIPNMLIDEAELPAGCASLADLPCVRSGDAKLV